jgi:hypothetical protein
MVEELLAAGANPACLGADFSHQRSLAMVCAAGGDAFLPMLTVIADAGADLTGPRAALPSASASASVAATAAPAPVATENNTPLLRAATSNHAAIADELIARGCSLDVSVWTTTVMGWVQGQRLATALTWTPTAVTSAAMPEGMTVVRTPSPKVGMVRRVAALINRRNAGVVDCTARALSLMSSIADGMAMPTTSMPSLLHLLRIEAIFAELAAGGEEGGGGSTADSGGSAGTGTGTAAQSSLATTAFASAVGVSGITRKCSELMTKPSTPQFGVALRLLAAHFPDLCECCVCTDCVGFVTNTCLACLPRLADSLISPPLSPP